MPVPYLLFAMIQYYKRYLFELVLYIMSYTRFILKHASIYKKAAYEDKMCIIAS
jgi:hypothetical protein